MGFRENRLDPDLQQYEPELEEQLRDCMEEMRLNRHWFDQETEPELIEQRIYEAAALQRRYDYLMRRARSLGVRGVL